MPEILAALAVKLNGQPKRLAGVNMTAEFMFTVEWGGPRYLLIRDGEAEIGEGQTAEATTTIPVKGSNFLLLMPDKLGPLAIDSGRVKVEGVMSIMPRFRQSMS